MRAADTGTDPVITVTRGGANPGELAAVLAVLRRTMNALTKQPSPAGAPAQIVATAIQEEVAA